MAGNTKDACTAEANGRESIAKAELEASYANTGEHRYDVLITKADAAYAIANPTAREDDQSRQQGGDREARRGLRRREGEVRLARG